MSWQPDRNNLYYVSASKGYRVGGVNVGVGTICGADLQSLGLPLGSDGQRHVPGQYSSDSLWSYELGGKNTFLDHTLQVDWSVFWINWKNIQQNVYLPSCGEQFTGESRAGESAAAGHRRPVPSDRDPDARPDRRLHRCEVHQELLCRRVVFDSGLRPVRR